LIEHAVVGLRFENEKPGQRGDKLKRFESLQLLVRGEAIGNVEHVALLLVIGKVVFGPGDQIIVSDQVAAFELSQIWHGGEQVVVADDEDFVGRAGGRIRGGQEDAGGVTANSGFAAAQIFKMQEGFELIVESGDFRGGYTRRERQNQPTALNLRRGKSGVGGGGQA
jgi:hypothetical protein